MTDDARLELLAQLQARDYHFTAVTPATHSRVLARPGPAAPTLRDIFGWNRSFTAGQIEPDLLALLHRAGAVRGSSGELRSRLRVASLGERLFLHSSFPTDAPDSVFFGPDTYRFCSFIMAELQAMPRADWIVDMGTGAGAGGIVAAGEKPFARLSLIDVNPAAVSLARVNACFAGVESETAISSFIPPGCDMVIANPPYMMDPGHRIYRDGGGLYGGELALDWARQALARLTAGGTLLLYTGAAIVDGQSPLLRAIEDVARGAGADIASRELDVDVFGEELTEPAYAQIERIAALGIRIVRR